MYSDADTSHRITLLAGIAVILTALLLRLLIARDAFWIDEVWSYNFARSAAGPLDILTVLKHDNNHPLNTLLLYLLGEQPVWSIYRLPALVSGAALIALAGPAARSLGLRPWLAMLLMALSIPLIQYSAEARGYSLAALFGLAAWYIGQAKLRNWCEPKWLAAFWVCCTLGILAHLSFVIVFGALGLAWLIERCIHRDLAATRLVDDLLIFGPPALLMLTLYAVFYGDLVFGGGQSEVDIPAALLSLVGLVAGAPQSGAAQWLAAAVVVPLAAFGIAKLPPGPRPFFALVMLAVPGVLLSLYTPGFFYPRYVLVCVPFLYLALASAIGFLLDYSKATRVAAGVLLLAYLAGSAFLYMPLLKYGKGGYPQAVDFMHERSAGQAFSVGSDFDFRNRMLLDFYTRYRKDAGQLNYVERAYEAPAPVRFFIVHNSDSDFRTTEFLRLANGHVYRIIAIFPHAGLSGWSWFLYEYAPDVTSPAE